jgi:protein-disulfide isomerase
MNKVTWSIFGAVIVLLLGGLIIYSQQTKTSIDVSNVDASSVLAASAQNGNIADHVFQDTTSKVTLVEYGDFQCPGCGAAHPNLKTLLADYGDKITFVFRNLPLTSLHPNARAAAAAAESAGLQGKYWEMHDKLYENQANWENLSASRRTELFKSYAREFNLDEAKFDTDIASDAVNNKISFDVALAKKVGASATPSFYLNGEKLEDGAATGILQGNLTEIKKVLDEKLAQ